MPVIMNEMLYRQQRLQEIHQEKEQALRKLMHSRQMASLGKWPPASPMNSNNAISVIERNAQWLSRHVLELLKRSASDTYRFAEIGIQKGRVLRAPRNPPPGKRVATQNYRWRKAPFVGWHRLTCPMTP
jgi:hypothetical protein